tara:strand:- start:9214 stop:10479 length:1266 start_codon:yes stop_codon:yes gene_type:complete
MIYYFLNKLNHWKRFPYFFVTPLVYAVGSACEEIKIAYSFSRKTKKKIFVLNVHFFQKILKYKVCNNSLFEDLKFENYTKLEKSIKSVVNFLLNIEFIFRRFFVLILKIFYKGDLSKYNFPIIGFEQMIDLDKNKINPKKNIFIDYNQIKKIDFIKNEIDLETIQNQYCINKLKFLNIPFDSLVLLHVRDEEYRNDKNRRSYRNSNINSYIESIKHLINQNYFVIRVGRSPSKEISFKDKNFFDYSRSNIQEDILDIFLIKNCKYFVGTQSGIFDMAQLFNKPILVTNMVELYCSYPLKINDRGIFKKIYHHGKQLDIVDYLKYDFNYHNPTNHIEDLSFEDNSEEEIFYSLNEFLDIQKAPTLSKIQKNFNKLLLYEHMKHYEKSPKKLFTIYSSYKVVRLVKNKEGCLTNFNLKKLSLN